jgi:receptor protein-tyrosine kinase
MAISRTPGSLPSSDHNAGADEWSGAECIRILRRRKATLVWITCAGILAAALISFGQSRIYQSRASLEIQGFNENFLNLRDIYPTAASSADSALYMQTQAELLQQDPLIEQVARKLGIEGRPEFQPPSTLLGRLRQDIKVVPVRNSRVIQIVCDARDPRLAADLGNTLALTFIEQSIETRQRAARQTYELLRLQLDNLRNGLPQPKAPAAAKLGPDGEPEALAPHVDVNRRFYQAMLEKANDARMAAVVRQSNIRLIGPAEPPAAPYKPNLPLNLAIGACGGLVLAIGCVMLQEQNTSVLRAPGEAGTYLILPELGAIPKDGAWHLSALNLLNSSKGNLRVERAALEQRSSSLSESFRATLTSILSAARNGDHPRILLVTSSRPMEGKTTVVSNLGIALAEISSKVLLIDGDMRRPQLHKIFDQANGWGLSDVLRERNAIDELPLDVLVKKTAVPHLYLLPSGACTDNIFGLLYSGRMARLLPRFREEFDYVLVDAPPCLEFADARVMARYAEGIVLVVRANYTDRKTAQAAVQRLHFDHIPVMGVILNRWDPSRSDMYGYPAYRGLGRPEIS